MSIIVGELLGCYFDLVLFRFGSGVSSIIIFSFALFWPWQFPRRGSVAVDAWIRIGTVVFLNSDEVGLSFLLPCARCWPKNSSRGSWQNLSDSKYFTPGNFSRNLAISTNALTENIINLIVYYAVVEITSPVICNPSSDSMLSCIIFFSAGVNPFLPFTLNSHSSNYPINSVSSHCYVNK